jgi:hypothetical protein
MGVSISWNFLMGFPGEDPQEYARMAAMIPALVHLQPPQGSGSIRLDRFSPYFNHPERFGMVNVCAASGYSKAYPFPPAVLMRLAYYFEYELADGRDPAGYVAAALEKIDDWRALHCPFGFTMKSGAQALVLRDRRPGAVQETGVLAGPERAAYEFLDSAHPLKAVQAHLSANGHAVEPATLSAWLESWVQKRWVVRDDDWYLGLAVPMDDLL